ncbi:hypothetical protein N658DRAFT_569862 [Parathielavia hyrcaniae]|uniref:Uncharacterized protein n=1 Tax=Parathielavia hyrcaniae TaxID=113614 RepID=A0AAN6SXG7_9PEZI|nr:hypothetical protein N658DRAFT_569862 [Parathielavia hyrcaniae]
MQTLAGAAKAPSYSRKLARLLKSHFDLIYLDAPIECDPGPGVVPEAQQAYWEGNAIRDLAREVRRLGVVGSSGSRDMGARVAMEVVRFLEVDDARLRGGGSEHRGCRGRLQPWTVPFQGGSRAYWESLAKGIVRTESVHLIGDADSWRPQSEELVKFFVDEGRRVIRFNGKNDMPINDAVNREAVE